MRILDALNLIKQREPTFANMYTPYNLHDLVESLDWITDPNRGTPTYASQNGYVLWVKINDVLVHFVPDGLLFQVPVTMKIGGQVLKWIPYRQHIFISLDKLSSFKNYFKSHLVAPALKNVTELDSLQDDIRGINSAVYDLEHGNPHSLDHLVQQLKYLASFFEVKTSRKFANHHHDVTNLLGSQSYEIGAISDPKKFRFLIETLKRINDTIKHFYLEDEGFAIKTRSEYYSAFLMDGKVVCTTEKNTDIYRRYQLSLQLTK